MTGQVRRKEGVSFAFPPPLCLRHQCHVNGFLKSTSNVGRLSPSSPLQMHSESVEPRCPRSGHLASLSQVRCLATKFGHHDGDVCVVISLISCTHSYWHGAVSVARPLFDKSSIPECSLLDKPVGIIIVELTRLIVRYVL